MILNIFIPLCYLVSISLIPVSSELFTAVVDLQNLLYTEGEIVKTLERYLEHEEQRLEQVRWLSKEYEKLYKAASQDAETFLSNPVNAYLLVKRLTADWKLAEALIDGSSSREIINNITHQQLQFPDDEDLSGAASALMRLQDTYLLDTSTLAQGQIEGTVASPELSAGDCFELGRQAYNNKDYYHTVLWMQEAFDRAEEEETKTAVKADILEYMAFSTYMLGNIKHAMKLTYELLYLDPSHPRARGNLVYYAEALQKIEPRGDRGDIGRLATELQTALIIEKPQVPERKQYEDLCRGKQIKSPAEESKLKCRYITNNHPYLLLNPVKEEELHLKPRIVIFHDVLSDKETEVIKQMATPKLARATVQNSESGALEIATYRISKSAWLKNEDHEVVKRISDRIEAITGLETDTAEELQVVNYGIGGHYEPHYDFARKEEVNAFKSLGTGNRIATWINYMSDVDAGGATVFPIIGVIVRPKKGSAGFWYNLHKNGEGDMDTRHAACPVLAGSKWVSNKWFHERGQEFRRPCSLDPDE